MGTTLDLQNELKALLGSDHVYFQPPSTDKMKYPCFVFERGSASATPADNKNYLFTKRYSITYIGFESDPDMVETVAKHFQMVKYDRHFVSDNLHHDVFSLYW